MKKSFVPFLFLFVFTAFFASIAFAGDPIPGLDVKLGKNPGGGITNTKTDKDGSFSLNLAQGSYNLNISYDQVQAVLKRMGKSGSEVTLSLNAGTNKHVLANDKAMPSKIKLDNSTGDITLTIPAGGATISGELTYDRIESRPGQRKK